MNRDFPNLVEADFDTLTPPEVETFNRYLVRQLGEAQLELRKYQLELGQTESDLEIEMARSRLYYGTVSKDVSGKNYTEQDKKDQALVDNAILAGEFAKLKTLVEIVKGRINVLKTQSELVRSMGVSVRTFIENERSSN